MLKKFLLIFWLFFFLNANNLFAKENNEGPIDIEDVKKLGLYEPLEEFPEGMMLKFNSGCDSITCQGKKAGSEVYYRFVKKKKSKNRSSKKCRPRLR